MERMDKLFERLSDLKGLSNLQSVDSLFVKIMQNDEVAKFVELNQIPMEQARLSLAKLNEYVTSLDMVDKTGYVPKLFMNYGVIDVTYIPSEERKRQEEEIKKASLISNGTMPINIQSASFNSLEYTDKRMPLIKAVKEFMSEYIKAPKDMHRGLFISGSYGIGKTYIMSAMANELASKGHRVRIEHYPTFLTNAKAAIKNDKVGELIKKIKGENILILDDIGAENLTEWTRDELLLVILEYHMANHLPTFFTSNLTMENFEVFLANTKEGRNELKAQRIMERVRFLADELLLEGKNRRNPKGGRNYDKG